MAAVLAGASTARISELRHDRLSGYGSLREDKQGQVRAWIDQLIGHGYLERTDDEYPTLKLTARGAAVLRGEETAPALTRARAVKATAADTFAPAVPPGGSAERAPRRPRPAAVRAAPIAAAQYRRGARRAALSDLQRRLAPRHGASSSHHSRGVPEVKGVGEWKSQAFGERFLALLRQPAP